MRHPYKDLSNPPHLECPTGARSVPWQGVIVIIDDDSQTGVIPLLVAGIVRLPQKWGKSSNPFPHRFQARRWFRRNS